MSDFEHRYREIAARIAGTVDGAERAALIAWCRQLLAIRTSADSPWEKAKAALKLTADSKVVWPVIRTLAHELKRLGWDERGTKGRFAIVGIGAWMLLFAAPTVAIVALGTAMAVPLWIVLGPGEAFVTVLLAEVEKPKDAGAAREAAVKYTGVDVERED